MNVKKNSSSSDQFSEFYTIRREETRSDSTSKESVLRHPFCDIIFMNSFVYTSIFK